MDFAKRQMEKYGWSEGQGLGKHSTGITTALKPSIKLNKSGIGHDPAEEFTYHWWEDAFNNACSNVQIECTKDGVNVSTVNESHEISAVKRAQIDRDRLKFGSFLKRETMTKSGTKPVPGIEADPIEESGKLTKMPETLSDEQLFEACGRLTAHKGARHGLTLSGKLQRVKEQEEAFLRSYQKTSRASCSNKTKIEDSNSDLSTVNADKNPSERGHCFNKEQSTGESEQLADGATIKKNKKKKKRKNSEDEPLEKGESIQVERSDMEATCVKKNAKKKKRKEENINEAAEESSSITGDSGRKEQHVIEELKLGESPRNSHVTEKRKKSRSKNIDESEVKLEVLCDTKTVKMSKKKKRDHETNAEESVCKEEKNGSYARRDIVEDFCSTLIVKSKKKKRKGED